MRLLVLSLSLAFSLLSVAHRTLAQTADNYDAGVLNDYFAFQLELIKVTPGFTPPVASRALGYSGLAAYEAVVHGTPGRISLAGRVPQLDVLPLPEVGQDYYWPEVVNAALFQMTAGLYSNMSNENLTALNALRDETTAVHAAEVDAAVLNASGAYGEELALAILGYANGDGQESCQFSNFPVEYVPPVGPGLWSPLSGQAALQPYWGDKRCFVVEFVGNDLLAPEPPAFSSEVGSELYAEAMAVYDASLNLTQEQTNIAQYWADGGGTVTPPGHSVSMLRQVIQQENSNLAFAAEAYARLGMAVADAFVQCWKTKYVYNLERPITYINSYIDADWTTLIGTPPFPEYTSGHSSQSGAFGEVMTALFGENYEFTDNTHGDQFGGPRSFTSFTQCAEETAISRLYGGIHYPIGNTMGSMSGITIGEMVNELFDEAVGVDSPNALAGLSIYPNPTQGQLVLNGNFSSDDQLLVFALTGQQVAVRQAQRQLDLSDLPAGVYMVTVANRGRQTHATTRLIIQ